MAAAITLSWFRRRPRVISIFTKSNALNIDASGDQMAQRSTFADLHDSSKRWNLDYL